MQRVILDTDVASLSIKAQLLATLNTKDFKDFAEYEGLVLLGT